MQDPEPQVAFLGSSFRQGNPPNSVRVNLEGLIDSLHNTPGNYMLPLSSDKWLIQCWAFREHNHLFLGDRVTKELGVSVVHQKSHKMVNGDRSTDQNIQAGGAYRCIPCRDACMKTIIVAIQFSAMPELAKLPLSPRLGSPDPAQGHPIVSIYFCYVISLWSFRSRSY
jgi:hypothetical protein